MTYKKPDQKTGVWLIGGLGSIAATVMVGTLALKEGLIPAVGMVTGTDAFRPLGLAPIRGFEFGGWDIRRQPVIDGARRMVLECGAVDPALLVDLADELAEIDSWIKPGVVHNCGQAINSLAEGAGCGRKPLLAEIDELRGHLRAFRKDKGLTDLVVVNLASTEPPLPLEEHHLHLASFEKRLQADDATTIRASSLYAYAAIMEGCPLINFTPTAGTLIPALLELAAKRRVPVMGNDGKTGETLVKSALAPMFLSRNLEILSWEGFNILGNMDGKVLENPENRATKIQSKDRVLSGILGYQPHSAVHINYVPSLGDQKTAWDFIHFQGFLGAKMSLQFTWQAYDSLLAAPLVLDLIRLAQFALHRGEWGLMPHLASFFKAPLGVAVFDHHQQFAMLNEYVRGVAPGQG
ncbi:MAG: inositol-3-phosphate synthase [Deltaproteobacteria bacterium]|nr:inositol-3-phosphate synthase [Deltaproteobacteria bacterium]